MKRLLSLLWGFSLGIALPVYFRWLGTAYESEAAAWFWLGACLLGGGALAVGGAPGWAIFKKLKPGVSLAAMGGALVLGGFLLEALRVWSFGLAKPETTSAGEALAHLMAAAPVLLPMGFTAGLVWYVCRPSLPLVFLGGGSGALLSGLAWLPSQGMSRSLWLMGVLIVLAGVLMQMASGSAKEESPQEEQKPAGTQAVWAARFLGVITGGLLALSWLLCRYMFSSLSLKAGAVLGIPALLLALGARLGSGRGTPRAQLQVGLLGAGVGTLLWAGLYHRLPGIFLESMAATGTSMTAYLLLRWGMIALASGLAFVFLGKALAAHGARPAAPRGFVIMAVLGWILVLGLGGEFENLRRLLLGLAGLSLLASFLARRIPAEDEPPPKGYWLNAGLPAGAAILGLLLPAWPGHTAHHQVFLDPHPYFLGTPDNLQPFFPEPARLNPIQAQSPEGGNLLVRTPFTLDYVRQRGGARAQGDFLGGHGDALTGLLPLVYRPESRRVLFPAAGQALAPAVFLQAAADGEALLYESSPGGWAIARAYLQERRISKDVIEGLGGKWTTLGLRSALRRHKGDALDAVVLGGPHQLDGGTSIAFSREAIRDLGEVLKDDGLLVVQFPLEKTSPRDILVLFALVHEEFPHMAVHFSGSALVLVASPQPLQLPGEAPSLLREHLIERTAALPVPADSTETGDTGEPALPDPSWLTPFGLGQWSHWKQTLVGFPEDIKPQWEFNPVSGDDSVTWQQAHRVWRLSDNSPVNLELLAELQEASATPGPTLLNLVLLGEDPNTRQAYMGLVEFLDNNPGNTAALAVFRKVVLEQADTLLSQGFPDRAVALLGGCFKYDPFQEEVLVKAGEAFYAARQADQSNNLFEQAYKVNHRNPLTLLRLGDLALKRNDLETAVRLLDQIQGSQQELQLYRTLRSEYAFKAGYTDQAVKLLTGLQKEYPGNQEYWYRLGRVYLGVNDGVRARRILEKGLKKMDGPPPGPYLKALAEACSKIGDEAAAQRYREQIPARPTQPQAAPTAPEGSQP